MEPQLAELAPFNASIMICFIVSTGICCNLLPSLFELHFDMASDVAYSAVSAGLMIIVMIGEITMIRLIRGKTAYHQSQEVFWPTRCRHCAKAIGILERKKSPSIIANSQAMIPPEHENTDVVQAQLPGVLSMPVPSSVTPPSIDSVPSERLGSVHQDPAELRILSLTLNSRRRTMFTQDPDVITRQSYSAAETTVDHVSQIDPTHDTDDILILNENEDQDEEPTRFSEDIKEKVRLSSPRFTRPHRSPLRIFTILSILSMVKIILVIVGDIICINHSNETFVRKVSFAVQALLNGTCGSILVVGFLFFTTYYDAVFVRKRKFCYPIGYMLGGCVWVIFSQIGYPFSALEKEAVPPNPEHPCKLNGTIGQFILDYEEVVDPFIVECGIIAACLFWQMWKAALPEGVLELPLCANVTFDHLISQKPNGMWGRMSAFLSNKYQNPSGHTVTRCSTDIKSLLPQNNQPQNEMKRSLMKLFSGLLLLVLINFTAIIFLRTYRSTPDASVYNSVYKERCCEIASGIPLIGLLNFQSFLTNKKSHSFPVKSGISVFHGLENSDRILLLGCGGIFIMNLLRFTGAIAFFISPKPSSSDERTLAYFIIVYALFKIYLAWLMTSFLFIVQRQFFGDLKKVKWSLISTMCTGIFSVTLWILGNTSVRPWVGLQLFFGEVKGWTFGRILDPFVSLYGIHSALVAFEAYREIYADHQLVRVQKDACPSHI